MVASRLSIYSVNLVHQLSSLIHKLVGGKSERVMDQTENITETTTNTTGENKMKIVLES